MKKILFFAAMMAATTLNAQVWHATTAESNAQQNHKEKNPDTGKDVTIIDAHGDVVCQAGIEGTEVATEIEGLYVLLMDGAADWEVMSNGVSSEGTVDTFVGQDGVTYSKGYVQGGTNGMPGNLQHANGVSAHIEFEAEETGIVYVAAKYGKNKAIWAAKVPTSVIEAEQFSYANCGQYILPEYSTVKVDETGAYVADVQKFPLADGSGVSATEATADVYAALPVAVEPGFTYMFWVSGSKIMLSGINFVAGATGVKNNAAAVKATKAIKNGQLVLTVGEKKFNVLGAEL